MQTFWGLKNLFIYYGNEFGNFCQTYGNFFFERPGHTALAGKMRQFTGKIELGQIIRKFFSPFSNLRNSTRGKNRCDFSRNKFETNWLLL